MSFADYAKKYSSRPIVLLEIDFTSGTRRYSKVDVASTAFYSGKVLRFGMATRALGKESGEYEVSDVTSVLSNLDLEFSKIAATETILNRNGRYIVGYEGMAIADFLTVISGVVSLYRFPGGQFEITFRDNSQAFFDKFPTKTVTRSKFSNLAVGAEGMAVPVIFGNVTSLNDSNDGAIPTIYVDRSGFRYLVAGHRMKAIDAVYKDGVLLGSGWTVVTDADGWTYIQFSAEQLTTGNLSVITCDGRGIEDVGDGSGNLITNPIDGFKKMLAMEGIAAGMLNTAAFAAASTIATGRQYAIGGGFWEQLDFSEAVKRFATSFDMQFFIDRKGLFSIVIMDPDPNATSVEIFTAQDSIIRDSFEIQPVIQDLTNRVQYNYKWHAAKQYFAKQPDLPNSDSIAALGREYKSNINLWMTQDKATADDAAQRRIYRLSSLASRTIFLSPLHALAVELGARIDITHPFGFSSTGAGWMSKSFFVEREELDLDRLQVKVQAIDALADTSNIWIFGDDVVLPANWSTADVTQRKFGFLCDGITGRFADNQPGKVIY